MNGAENMENIVVHNASENNLKNITVKLPINKFTCITGPSGCGKSSLVYDTIYAESQRSFLESVSGNLFGQKLMDKPAVDSIENLRPALNVSQTYYNVNPRSTVGTITDISYYLRTLYAFIYNQSHSKSVDMNYFSPNNPTSCCPLCHGLGEEYIIDEKALMPNPAKPLSSGGITYYKGSKTSMEFKLLNALCLHFGIDIEKKVGDLTETERQQLLYRRDVLEIPLRFKSPNGKYRQKTIKSKGAFCELQEKLLDIDTPSTFLNISKYLKKAPCSRCGGLKLKKDILDICIAGYNIGELEQISLVQLSQWLNSVYTEHEFTAYSNQILHLLNEIRIRAKNLIDLNLEYISIGRSIPTLSGGELQRVRIANQLDCSLSGLIYILDEPCKGLHYRNVSSVVNATKRLIEKGNTVLAIEHNHQYISAAERVIELGPTGGPSGGYIISEHQGGSVFHPKIRFKSVDPAKDFISFTGITHHNLNNIDVSFPFGKITCITGVSGSGKSSVTDIIEEICSNKNYTHCRDFFNVSKIKRVMRVNQQPIGKTPRSTVVSYLGIYDTIREIFSKTERAKELNLTASDFSMNTAGGRCECCQGTGKQKIELTYLPETYITCPECKGYRFKKDVLSVKYNGYSINDILNTPISKLMDIFYDNETISGVLQCVIEIGLGYLSLGQMSMSLSGGEAQRIKLAKSLSVKSRGNGLYILDEPTSGLNDVDIQKVEYILNRLSKNGETILIIEHNLEFIARIADYLVDLGCVAGDNGGKTVIAGDPKKVISSPKSSWYFINKMIPNDN